jgi:hypothetical protein
MQRANNIAFKEWAVVCAALASGRQTIILRKGGIDEGHEGFRVQHNEFWLLPTRFHQAVSQLTEEAEPLLRQVGDSQLPQGEFRIDLYAAVQHVFEVREIDTVKRLAGHHVLSDNTIEQRFHYRHPGLFVLLVRTYRLQQPYHLSDSPYIAGCKSWVELPATLSTDGATAVLDDATFKTFAEQIQIALK